MSQAFNFGNPATPDQSDGGQNYTLGCEWFADSIGPCSGNRWRAPTNPPVGQCIMTLHRVSDQALVAQSLPFTPANGIDNDVLFTAPFNTVANEHYVSGVVTNRYAFTSPGGFPFTTTNLTAPASGGGQLNGRLGLTAAGVPVFPGTGSAANFSIGPLWDPAAGPPVPPSPTPVVSSTVLTAAAIVTGIGICIENELDATLESGGGPVRTPGMRTCLLVPGNIAWDGCECGQLALSIQGIWPTKVFPNDASADPIGGGCMVRPLAVNVLVSITRCIPGMTNGMPPQPPSCDALLAAALEQQADAFAVRKAVECCLADLKSQQRRILDFRVGRTTFTGPDGGCGGSELPFTFQLL